MLTDIIPGKARKVVYAVYAIIGVIFGSFQVAYSTNTGHYPAWLAIATTVFLYIGTSFGLTAASNIHGAEVVPGQVVLKSDDTVAAPGLREAGGMHAGVPEDVPADMPENDATGGGQDSPGDTQQG